MTKHLHFDQSVVRLLLEIILNSSGDLKSAHDKVINHVGIPNCFTIAGGEPGICLKNKCLILRNKILCYLCVWSYLGSCYWFPMNFLVSNVCTIRYFFLFYYKLSKEKIFRVWCKTPTVMQQSGIEVFHWW